MRDSVSVQAAYEPDSLPSISASSDDASAWKGDLLAVGVYEDALTVEEEAVSIADDGLAKLDSTFSGLVTELLEGGDFKAKKVRAPAITTISSACCVVLWDAPTCGVDGNSEHCGRWPRSVHSCVLRHRARAA